MCKENNIKKLLTKKSSLKEDNKVKKIGGGSKKEITKSVTTAINTGNEILKRITKLQTKHNKAKKKLKMLEQNKTDLLQERKLKFQIIKPISTI